MKNILTAFILVGIAAYLIFVVVTFTYREDEAKCQQVSIVIADSAQATLITEHDVVEMLQRQRLYPKGLPMHQIDLRRLERGLQADPFIQHVMCVKTPGENVKIYVVQRLPLLRILANDGADYYVDDKGFRMAARGYEADLAVVTGDVSEDFVRKKLLPLGTLLKNDDFWNSQVEQIHVLPDGTLDLITRVGDQLVHLGRAEHFDIKLRNLRAFYEKVMPSVGWHRYSALNVAYENQVIAIK